MGASLFLDMFGRLIPYPLFTFTLHCSFLSLSVRRHDDSLVTLFTPIHNRIPRVFLFSDGRQR